MAKALTAVGKSADGLEIQELDLSSLASVRRFGAEFRSSKRPLQLLCLNAGIMAIPQYTESKDGFELQFATNHLGHFALAKELEPVLEASAPARVVTVSSTAHFGNAMDVENLPPSKDSYGDWGAYQQSKLANALFANELARRFQARGISVTSNSLHPGVIPTNLGRQQFLKGKALLNVFKDRGEEEGAATSVYCLTATSLEGVTGRYFKDCAPSQPSASAQDAEAARRLWERSEELLKMVSA